MVRVFLRSWKFSGGAKLVSRFRKHLILIIVLTGISDTCVSLFAQSSLPSVSLLGQTRSGQLPVEFSEPVVSENSSETPIWPGFLRRPIEAEAPLVTPLIDPETIESIIEPITFEPLGHAGSTSVSPLEPRTSLDRVPIADRWRIGFPAWDRAKTGGPVRGIDSPYDPGSWWDPYHQNVLKGDYAIFGQNVFLNITAKADLDFEGRQIPTQTSPFESTARAFSPEFYGRSSSFITLQYYSLGFELFQGDAGFKQPDWKLKILPVWGVSNFSFSELAQTSPNVLEGTSRLRTYFNPIQEGYLEYRLADVSPDFDFISIRMGNQPFITDFRGFLFQDTTRGIRFFGNLFSNRGQWNLAYFRQWEKDTNTALNTFNDRPQNLFFANYYHQDFLFPGYTVQFSLSYDNDLSSFKFDKNRFLTRPDGAGVFQRHTVNAAYFGFAGDGHIERFNFSHQFYWAFGNDTLNPIANQPVTINAQMAAIEASYDRDWVRFKSFFFWSSGDPNVNDNKANGFDTILDNPNFAGGQFSYWNRQQLPLFAVNLTQRLSLVPDMRNSKIQSQANFVNPGIMIPGLAMDMDLTPKLRMISTAQLLWFDQTSPLKQFLFDGNIRRFIGGDLSTGFEYRPLLSENVTFVGGVSMLIPGEGFQSIYSNFGSPAGTMVTGFANLVLAY
ncbi:MAG: hypothetical protein RJA81_2084 [Planctomycetota bacterium]